MMKVPCYHRLFDFDLCYLHSLVPSCPQPPAVDSEGGCRGRSDMPYLQPKEYGSSWHTP